MQGYILVELEDNAPLCLDTLPESEGKLIAISVSKEPNSNKNFGNFHRRNLNVYDVRILSFKTVNGKAVVRGRHLPAFELSYHTAKEQLMLWTLNSYAEGVNVIATDRFGSIKETISQMQDTFSGRPEIIDLSYKSKALSMNYTDLALNCQYGKGQSVCHDQMSNNL